MMCADPESRTRRAPEVVRDDLLRLVFTCCHPALAPGRAGGAGPAHAGRADHCRGRPGAAGARGDHGQAADPGQAEDRAGPASRTGCPGPRAARPAAARAGHRLPDLQRGVRRHLRAPTWCAPSSSTRRSGWPGCWSELQPDEPSAARVAGADAAAGLPRRGPGRRRAATVLLADQDRRVWDRGKIARGRRAGRRGAAADADRPDRYVVQAAIAACHALAPRATPRPTGRGGLLVRRAAHRRRTRPVVRLNRAAAVAERDGPRRGSPRWTPSRAERVPVWHATRAELLQRLGRATRRRPARPTSGHSASACMSAQTGHPARPHVSGCPAVAGYPRAASGCPRSSRVPPRRVRVLPPAGTLPKLRPRGLGSAGQPSARNCCWTGWYRWTRGRA